eukprot:scaffold19697_cov172-Skeletonema_dohrnii-CCMP3373.AAC.3
MKVQQNLSSEKSKIRVVYSKKLGQLSKILLVYSLQVIEVRLLFCSEEQWFVPMNKNVKSNVRGFYVLSKKLGLIHKKQQLHVGFLTCIDYLYFKDD